MTCRATLCFQSDDVDEVAKEAFPAYRSDFAPFGELRNHKSMSFEEVVVSQLQVLERKIEQLHDCCSILSTGEKPQDFKQLLAGTEARLREELNSSTTRLEMRLKSMGQSTATSSENLPMVEAQCAQRPRRYQRHAHPPARSAQLAQSRSHLSLESAERIPVNTHAHLKTQSSGLVPRSAHMEHQHSFATLLTALATASYSGKAFPRRLSTTNFSVASAAAVASTTRPSALTQASAGTSVPQSLSPQSAMMQSNEQLGERNRSKRSSLMQHPDMGRMLMRLQNTRATVQVWNFLETPESSHSARWYVRLMVCVILSSVMVTFLQTLSPPVFHEKSAVVAEIAFDVIFVTELSVRFAVCPDRLMFFKNVFNCIDLLASLPVLVRLAGGWYLTQDEGSTEFALLVGAVPVFRLLKILRHFEKFQLLLSAFGMAFEALPVLLFTLLIIVMISSFMIYLAEPRSTIESLPFSMWFTIVTMTTVGYGDIVPATPVGYGVTVSLIIGSVLYMSIPIGIVGNAFSRVWEDRDRLLLVQRTRDCLLKGGYKPQDIPGLFAIFDRHHSGELTFPAFRRMLAEMKIGLSQERIVSLFRSFDANSDGTISAEEFVKVLFPEAHAEMYGTDLEGIPSAMDEAEDDMDMCMGPNSSVVASDAEI